MAPTHILVGKICYSIIGCLLLLLKCIISLKSGARNWFRIVHLTGLRFFRMKLLRLLFEDKPEIVRIG